MAPEERGPLLYAYRPIPANPMTVALLILVLVVTLLIGPIAAGPEGLWPLGGLCFLPLALILAAMVVFKPSPTFVFENGIEISLPLWQRILGERRTYAWSEIHDVYPRSYEVAGSFLSPFASSAGTLVHTGIGLETNEGRRLLIRFTPGSIRAFRAETRGYLEAMAVIRDRFARNGKPMVTTAKAFSDAQVLEMQAHAHAPLVPVEGVFLAFFLPPAIVAALLLGMTAAGIPLTSAWIAIGLIAAFLPPVWSMARTLRRSERRNEILSDLAKYQEHRMEISAAAEGGERSDAS
ncbi:MAG: hypothetical protein L3J78_01925 [Thermoplasmata archaeon]|nr:hypothetical protein [Thermoplasmata archaeon]